MNIMSLSGKVILSGLPERLEGVRLDRFDLTNADLRNADLARASFAGARLTGANFSGAVLGGANLSGTSATGADFTGATLSTANLSRANLIGAKFRKAHLYGADLRRTRLDDADFDSADLSNAAGNGIEIKSMHVGPYAVVQCGNRVWIGCHKRTLRTWKKISEQEMRRLAKEQDRKPQEVEKAYEWLQHILAILELTKRMKR